MSIENVMGLAVLVDAVGQGLEAPVFYTPDLAAVCFDDTLVLFDEGIDLLCGNVLAGKEYMFIKSHGGFAFLALIVTRYSAAKPQRLFYWLQDSRQESVVSRRSRAETREAGSLWILTGFITETGPPFSHQPEDRVLRTARLYGFLARKQGGGLINRAWRRISPFWWRCLALPQMKDDIGKIGHPSRCARHTTKNGEAAE